MPPLLLVAGGLALLSAVPDLQRWGPFAVLASFGPVGVLAAGASALLLTALLLTGLLTGRGRQESRAGGRVPRPRALHPRQARPALGLVLALASLLVLLAPSLSVPAALSARGAGAEGRLRVVALNMLSGQADVADLTNAAAGADVVVLSEVTPAAQQRVLASDLAQQLPYTGGEGAGGFVGTTVLSRYPMETVTVLELSFQQRLVRVEVPELGAVHVLAVHPVNPLGGSQRWEDEHQQLIELAGTVEGPLVVAGDFNAVDQHLVMHRWRAAGLVDAAHSSGSGWLRTWPADSPALPLLGIDHVLTTCDLRGTGVSTFRASGSDHLGIRAVLELTDRD